MKMSKLKAWIEDHREEIKTESIRILWYAIGLGVGWFVGNKLAEYKYVANVLDLNNVGLLKFTDPSTGLGVTIKEAYEICKRM